MGGIRRDHAPNGPAPTGGAARSPRAGTPGKRRRTDSLPTRRAPVEVEGDEIQVSDWRPPPEVYQQRLPGDTQVVDFAPTRLRAELNGTFPFAHPDMTSASEQKAAKYLDEALLPDFWKGQAVNGRTSLALSWDTDDLTYDATVQITAKPVRWQVEALDGVEATDEARSEVSLETESSAERHHSQGAEAAIEHKGIHATVSEEDAEQRGGAVTSSVGGDVSRGAEATPTIRFRLKIEWRAVADIRVEPKPTLATRMTGISTRDMARSWRTELTIVDDAVVRFPRVRCRPVTTA